MPDFHLPDFRQEFLLGISVCSRVRVTDPAVLGQLPVRSFAKYRAADSDAIFVVQIDEWRGEGDGPDVFHIHLNVDRIEHAGDTDMLEELNVDDLKLRLTPLIGLDVRSFITADFAVPIERLPRRGLINTLLEVSTSTESTELFLRGSKFAVHGDTFEEIEWRVDEDDETCIEGELSGHTESTVSADFVTQIADLLQDGVECFVLESSGSVAKNARDKDEKLAKRAQG